MSEAEGLAKFGLFLALAFVLPGIIYVGFVALYFPDILEHFGWDINSWVGLLGLPVFLGLLITSLCFAIEVVIIWPIFRRMRWKLPEIPLLGGYEAGGLRTFYINQVFGQYTCHLNVALGVLLLLLVYVGRPYIYSSYFILTVENLFKLLFGLLIFLVNFFLALNVFRKFCIGTIEKYEKAVRALNPAIIFDLDNTLIDTYGVYWNAKYELSQEIRKLGGSVPDKIKFVDEIFEIDRELCKRFHTWDYDQRELVKEACKKASCRNFDLDRLTKDYEENLRKMPKAFKKAKDTLTTLKSKGIYLVLLSERTEEERKQLLKSFEFDRLFDDTQFVGRKEKKHFDGTVKFLRDMGHTRIYCVGDSVKKDILFGNSAGADTIWIPSKWEVIKPEKTEEWPKHKVDKIEDILKIIDD